MSLLPIVQPGDEPSRELYLLRDRVLDALANEVPGDDRAGEPSGAAADSPVGGGYAVARERRAVDIEKVRDVEGTPVLDGLTAKDCAVVFALGAPPIDRLRQPALESLAEGGIRPRQRVPLEGGALYARVLGGLRYRQVLDGLARQGVGDDTAQVGRNGRGIVAGGPGKPAALQVAREVSRRICHGHTVRAGSDTLVRAGCFELRGSGGGLPVGAAAVPDKHAQADEHAAADDVAEGYRQQVVEEEGGDCQRIDVRR